MSACCQTASDSPSQATLTVALAGNPNSGKTTIFNALTGLRQKVANYPGVTVEKKTGRFKSDLDRWIDVIDLPGTYSLISRSPDERVAMEVLRGLRPDTPAPDVVVVVVDASNLQRNLYLVSQLIELGRPMVVALNMIDVADRRGLSVSADKLQQQLGVPVIPIIGHKHKGIAELKAAVLHAKVAPLPAFDLPEAMKSELMHVGEGLAVLDSAEDLGLKTESRPLPQSSVLSPQSPVPPRAWICLPDNARRIDRYQALAERLLIGDRADDIAPIAEREPVAHLLDEATSRLKTLGIDPMHADVEAHYRWIENVASASRETQTLDYAPVRTLTDKLDRVLIHRFWGLLIFAAVMSALFVTLFWLADPIMGAFEAGIGWLGALVGDRMPDGPIKDLWTDGIVAGVGGVLVFVPQIALLFLFLAILEDSGYLARAAFLMDKLLAKVGLHGKSFIPLLSSFACAIPGIMATRTIENRKDRLATIFVAPFMSCAARLPVYTLLIGAFFAGYGAVTQAGIMLALYGLGIIAAAGTAWVFKRSMLKGPKSAFILEMPTYKLPQASQVARVVVMSTWAFIAKAGTIIFCLSVILWALMYYPRLPETKVKAIETEFWQSIPSLGGQNTNRTVGGGGAGGSGTSFGESPTKLDSGTFDEMNQGAFAERLAGEQLRHSYAGRFGHLIEPAIKPLGYDWKMGVGLVGAFAAREVFVSTMGIVYSVGGDDEDTAPLEEQMRADRYPDGRPVWTPAVAASLLVWFVLAMQCMSTLAIVKRETNSWTWPIAMLIYMNALAYVVALGVYQIGRHWVP